MRLTAILAGILICAAVSVINSPQAYAETDNQSLLAITEPKNDVINAVQNTEEQPEAPKPTVVEYIVKDGDSLAKIAEAHGETWQRLFNKNANIADPNMITAGDKIVIPNKDEQLAERPLPVYEPIAAPAATGGGSGYSGYTRTGWAGGGSAGNRYYAGYCTWYAKERRADLPNNLGNAETWASRAAAQGYTTGSAPRAGAIGQQGNHVVYVESVNPDGSANVSDMNYAGHGVVTTRTVPAGSHQYIY